MELVVVGGVENDAKALAIVRAAAAAAAGSTEGGGGGGGDAHYMCIDYKWPADAGAELRQLRHELDLFAYHRRALPFAMEGLALDIIVTEACCVRVLDTLDALDSTADAQHAWAIVCFAVLTIFDLRPGLHVDGNCAASGGQRAGSSVAAPVLVQLDARRNNATPANHDDTVHV